MIRNQTAATNPRGHTTYHAYDPLNRQTAMIQPASDPSDPSDLSDWSYDHAGNHTAVTNPRGHTTCFVSHALSRTASAQDPRV